MSEKATKEGLISMSIWLSKFMKMLKSPSIAHHWEEGHIAGLVDRLSAPVYLAGKPEGTFLLGVSNTDAEKVPSSSYNPTPPSSLAHFLPLGPLGLTSFSSPETAASPLSYLANA
ncbi:MAG TPA: hypothetical protein V6D20_24845 [Candidatus Obscuribacterales bacterium]